MSKPKHTPGPWGHVAAWGLIVNESGDEIAACHAGRTGRKSETKANATLIAAAPELYACVFSLLRNFPELGTDKELNGADLVDWLNDQLPYWKDALAKAEGQSR